MGMTPAAIAAALRARGFSDQQIADATINGKRLGDEPVKEAKPKSRFKSKLEQRYAEHLENQRVAGEIKRWAYEALKFRLADGALFTPDFCVWLNDGSLELRETKGHMREAARVRFLVARELYPEFQWRMIQASSKGGWVEILKEPAK
jgi:hypothetical protein